MKKGKLKGKGSTLNPLKMNWLRLTQLFRLLNFGPPLPSGVEVIKCFLSVVSGTASIMVTPLSRRATYFIFPVQFQVRLCPPYFYFHLNTTLYYLKVELVCQRILIAATGPFMAAGFRNNRFLINILLIQSSLFSIY